MSIQDFALTKEEKAEEAAARGKREKVLASLGVMLHQSSRHLCQNTGLSVDEVLSVVEAVGADDQIGCKFVGGIMVYFLKENAPAGRIWNTGRNYFAVEKVEKTEPHPDIGKQVILNARKSRYDGEGVPKPKYSPEQITDTARRGLTKKEAAKEFGVSDSTFISQLGSNFHLNNAWEKGVRERGEKKTENLEEEKVEMNQAVAEKTDKAVKKSSKEIILENLEHIENWAAKGLKRKEVAAELGIGEAGLGFYYSSKNDGIPEYRAAWDRGAAKCKQNKADAPIRKNIPVSPEEDEAFAEIEKRQYATAMERTVLEKIEFDKSAVGDYEAQTVSNQIEDCQPANQTGMPGLKNHIEPCGDSYLEIDRASFGLSMSRLAARNPNQSLPRFDSQTDEEIEASDERFIEALQSLSENEEFKELSETPVKEDSVAARILDAACEKNRIGNTNNSVIELKSGGMFMFGFTGNLFEHSAEDRAFINSIIDTVQNYEADR